MSTTKWVAGGLAGLVAIFLTAYLTSGAAAETSTQEALTEHTAEIAVLKQNVKDQKELLQELVQEFKAFRREYHGDWHPHDPARP